MYLFVIFRKSLIIPSIKRCCRPQNRLAGSARMPCPPCRSDLTYYLFRSPPLRRRHFCAKWSKGWLFADACRTTQTRTSDACKYMVGITLPGGECWGVNVWGCLVMAEFRVNRSGLLFGMNIDASEWGYVWTESKHWLKMCSKSWALRAKWNAPREKWG